MLNRPQDLTYWNANAPAANFPQLASDISVDVAIIGGGIVGITTARLLKDAGLTVTVIEAREVGRQVTGKSTAKITSQHSIIYQTLERTFGEDRARLYAEAKETAIARIRSLASQYNIQVAIYYKAAYTSRSEEHTSEL